MRDSRNVVLEGLHDNDRLAWSQRVVDEGDCHDGELVALDCLAHRLCSLFSRQILISEVDCRAFNVLDQKIGTG